MQNARRYPAKSLQHGFSRHASDFGVAGNWSEASGKLFIQAIEDHITAASIVISGTFRGVLVVTHYFNPTTHLWVAFDQMNTFVAGWKLYPSQIVKLLTKGDIT